MSRLKNRFAAIARSSIVAASMLFPITGWCVAGLVAAGFTAAGLSCQAIADEPDVTGKPRLTPKYWVGQLGHDQYLRREDATKRLIEAGEAAVPALSDAIRKGDLETTTLSIRVLSDVALMQPPDQEGGAWGALKQLSVASTGSRQAIAKKAVIEIENQREFDAIEALDNAGIFVGEDDFAVGALTSRKQLLRIDDNWDGNIETLRWLRWVRRIEYLSLRGKAVMPKVIDRVVEMPDVHTIGLIDAKATMATLKALQKLERINSLEIRYVTLDDEVTDMIANLPIRESLNLMGTGVTDDRVAKMRADLPGLKILHRHGGFLGVTCNMFGQNRCEITGVLPGSAAFKAGLQRMDVVTAINDQPVAVFADLQKIINTQLPGADIEVTFMRGVDDEPRTTKLQLGRQLD